MELMRKKVREENGTCEDEGNSAGKAVKGTCKEKDTCEEEGTK